MWLSPWESASCAIMCVILWLYVCVKCLNALSIKNNKKYIWQTLTNSKSNKKVIEIINRLVQSKQHLCDQQLNGWEWRSLSDEPSCHSQGMSCFSSGWTNSSGRDEGRRAAPSTTFDWEDQWRQKAPRGDVQRRLKLKRARFKLLQWLTAPSPGFTGSGMCF